MAQIDVSKVEAQAATAADIRPSGRGAVRLWSERIGVLLIALGILGLVQPWVQDLFTNGFTVLLIGTLIFIVASHV